MKLKHYKISTGECLECNNCMECEICQTWLGLDDECKYYSECEDACGKNGVIVLQVKQMSSSNKEKGKRPKSLVVYVKIVLSALFSFGLFEDIVYSLSFENRLRLYNLVVMSWIIIALILGFIIGLYAECPHWGIIGSVGIAVFSYGGFQMFNFESKNLCVYKCNRDSYGIWKLNRITDMNRLYNRHYLEYLLPILFFYKRIKFLWYLKSCNTFLSETETSGISKLLENGIRDSEHLFAVVKGRLCRVKLDNGLEA